MVYTQSDIRRLVEPVAREFGLRAVYLFGSYARGEATESSDVDLLIDTTGTSIKSLVKLGEVYCALETALKKPVDVLTVSALDQRPCVPSEEHFRERVRKERVEVYVVA